jgi:hypothetical protein
VSAVGPLALAVTAAWIWRQRRDAGFWLPRENARREARGLRLTPAADWRTLLTYVFFMFVWMVLLRLT